jgi:serine O-acetyltransferase
MPRCWAASRWAPGPRGLGCRGQAGAGRRHGGGQPGRIIQAEADAKREAAAARMGFSAYGVTSGDDPVAQAMKGLIDNASSHEHQIALLWQAIEKLSMQARELPADTCVPQEARTTEQFDAERLNRLVK